MASLDGKNHCEQALFQAKNEQKLIKNKEVELSVMTVDEAITQMELIDHDFYMFINEENHKQTII